MTYNIIRGYAKKDNTMVKDDQEIVEYPVHKNIATFKDARTIMKAIADKEEMSIVDYWNAIKENETEDIESGIIMKEKEWVRIETVV